MRFTCDELAKMIDHALLGPKLTDEEVAAGCRIAKAYHVAGVCVKPYAVGLAADLLKGSGVKVGTVIGFPHGANATAVKAAEAERACRDGAEELDMVVNIGKVLGGDWDFVARDIEAVVAAGRAHGAIVKVIFENCYLGDEQKIRLCAAAAAAGAAFVKTSTGFGDSGATLADVRLMRRHTPAHVRIKASGGIRTLEQFLDFRAAGADRIGVSATAAILEGCRRRTDSESSD